MANLDPVAKAFIIGGILLVLIGISWHFGWIQQLRLGRLPGDIHIQRDNFSFFFPITTSILLSAIFMLVSWLYSWLSGR
jgi:hypothetical protein